MEEMDLSRVAPRCLLFTVFLRRAHCRYASFGPDCIRSIAAGGLFIPPRDSAVDPAPLPVAPLHASGPANEMERAAVCGSRLISCR